MRTCVRIVSIKGSSVARLERALATRNPMLVRAAAAELRHVALPEALAICLLLLDAEPERYHAAAARWAGRFVVEHPGISVGEAQLGGGGAHEHGVARGKRLLEAGDG